MEVNIPNRWLAVPAIRQKLRTYTGRFIRSRLKKKDDKAKSHRLDVVYDRQRYIKLSESQIDGWDDIENEVRNMYYDAYPPRHVKITFFRSDGNPSSATLTIPEWDGSIPQNTVIEQDSEPWNKLLTLVADDPDNLLLFNLTSGNITHVKVQLLEKVKKPKGRLIDRKLRDATQATPSHPYLQVEWTEHGFLPKGQPFATQGDCLPRALMYGLKPSWDKTFKTPLTINTITDFCKSTAEMSVPELQPFLEYYRLSLHVLDIQGKIIYAHIPETRHKKLASCFYVLLHNQHATLLNHNLQSLQRKDSIEHLARPSKHFQMGKMDGTPIVIREFEDLQAHMKNATEYTRVYYMGDMNDAFSRIASEMKLEASLKFDRHETITELSFHSPPISILHLEISLSILKPLRDSVFIPTLKSTYSEALQRAFCDLPRGHLKRAFVDRQKAPFIDIVRSYTANVMELEYIPVFSQLDDFVPYDQKPMEPYTLYVIRKQQSLESWFIANNEYNIVSGFVLKASGIPFIPLAMCRPSSIQPNTIRDTLKKLYEDPTNPDLKIAVNLVLGMAGKRFNKKHYGRFTTDPQEAYHFSNNVRQELHGYLAKSESASVELVDGFYPLYFMIYDLQRLRLLNTYRMLEKHTEILGVHTDGFFVRNIPKLPYHEGIKTIDALGRLQLEAPKMTPITHYTIETETTMPKLVHRQPYTQVPEVQSGTFIDAEIAGAGKTHAALNFLTQQSLIVIQSDKQIVAMEERVDGIPIISYATLLGQIFEDNKLVKTKAPHDVSKYDHILLDELFQIPVQDYERVLVLLKGNSVIGTGDTFQTTTGVCYNNYADRRTYYEETLWKLFPNRMTLKRSHRLEDPADEAKILQIRKQLQNGASIQDVIHHFKQTTDLKYFKTHIPYTNLCAQKLERLFGTEPSHLRFKDYDKKKRPIEKSGLPITQDAEGIHYIMKDGKRQQYLRKGVVYPVKHHILEGKHMVKVGNAFYNRCRFVGTHANTGHSLQGDTIRHPFCILEWNHTHASWEWFYTAITRCVRLSDVYIYTGKSLTSGTHKNIYAKLEGYKVSDSDRGFNLTAKWIQDTLKQQNYCCAMCSGLLELDYAQGDPKQWSVDRRDNSQGHLQSNCRITHLGCNQSIAHEGKN